MKGPLLSPDRPQGVVYLLFAELLLPSTRLDFQRKMQNDNRQPKFNYYIRICPRNWKKAFFKLHLDL